MNIPTEFKGKLFFYWNVKHNFMHVTIFENQNDPDYIKVGECDVDVPFKDCRQEAVAALEKQIEDVRAESRNRIDILQGRIQQLLAIEAVA